MKLQPDRPDFSAITGYGTGWIGLGNEKITHHLIVGSHGELQAWDCQGFADLGPEHFARLADFGPELILFGSGQSLRRPPAAWQASLAARGIGLEVMDTLAACRTYNILAGEGRHVLAALLLEYP
ncbi:MAG: Mth938-like domain-containing protein [Hylemonella sp.]|jgi:uncharacterized protein